MSHAFTTPAGATVDPLDPITGGGRYWRVTVETPAGWPKYCKRVYTIAAWTDTQAGQMGLERFAEEIDGHRRQPVFEGVRDAL